MPPLARMSAYSFDVLLEPLDAALPQDELHAGLVLVGAVAVLVEHPDDGLAPVQQALLGDKLVQQLRLGGQRSQPAADHHAESAPALADHRAQADIVDRARDAILPGAAIEGDLEFARQIAGEVLAQKGVRHLLRVGAHVENFVAGDAAHGQAVTLRTVL
jgi:hypothetical protein